MKTIENDQERKNPIPLDVKNFLFKQAKLRNTDWVIGMALYVGSDSKVQKNSGKSVLKDSKLRQQMDMVILFLFFFQIFLCMFGIFGRDI